jgi:hypothetical protein
MPYVRRNASDGRIESLHRDASEDAFELLAPDHPEVRAFVGLADAAAKDFNRLDAEFVRVIEDLIDTLISRNVIAITDLPEQAQAKLCARKTFRERSGRNALQLFGEQPFGPLIDDSQLGDLH